MRERKIESTWLEQAITNPKSVEKLIQTIRGWNTGWQPLLSGIIVSCAWSAILDSPRSKL
jgi:hypothetical protein